MKILGFFLFCSHGLGQEPTHRDNRGLFTRPGLVETPTQTHTESSPWRSSHTLPRSSSLIGRNLHSEESSQSVRAQTAGTAARFTFRILLEYFSQKC